MKFDVTVNATIHLHQYVHGGESELGCKLDKLLDAAKANQEGQEKIMATLDEVNAKLDEATQKLEAADVKLDDTRNAIAQLRQELADALAGTTLPPSVQQGIDAAFGKAEALLAKSGAIESEVDQANSPSA